MSAAYTAWHNDAATKKVEAIGKGEMGQCIVESDVGILRRRAELPMPMETQSFMQCVIFLSTISLQMQHALSE
jgi:hypothetical protein